MPSRVWSTTPNPDPNPNPNPYPNPNPNPYPNPNANPNQACFLLVALFAARHAHANRRRSGEATRLVQGATHGGSGSAHATRADAR